MAHSQSTGMAAASRPGDTLVLGMALVVRWFLVLVLLVLPLDVYLVLPPHQPVAFLSQILAAEGACILLAALGAARIFKTEIPFAMSWGDVLPLGAILVIAVLSAVGAGDGSAAVKGCLKIAGYLGLYLIARAVRAGSGLRAIALATMLIACVVVFTAGYVSIIPNVPDVIGTLLNIQRTAATLPASTVVRADATFRYPNELAAYLLLVIPIVLAFVIKAPSTTERLSYALLGTMGVGLLFLTYTRGALIALIVTVPLLCYVLGGRRVFMVGTVVLLALAGGLFLGSGAAGHRYLTVLSLADSGYTTRFAIWHWAFSAFLTHPLLGVGVGNLQFQPHAPYIDASQGIRAVDAENLYLNVLAELGVVGFIPVVLALGGAVRRTWRGLQANWSWLDQGWNAGVLGGIVACLIYGVVDPVLVSGQVTGMLCVLAGLVGPLAELESDTASGRSGSTSPRASVEIPVALRDQLFSTRSASNLHSRIIFLVNSMRFGGAEQHSFTLAEALRDRGVKAVIICPPTAQFIPQLETRRIPYRTMTLGMNAGRWRGYLGTLALLNPWSRMRLRGHIRMLAAEEPTLFVCPFPREQVLVARLSREERSVRTLWVLHAPLHFLPHRLIVRPLLIRLASRVGAIVAIAPHLANHYIQLGVPEQLMTVIPNMVAPPSVMAAAPLERRAPAIPTIGVASRLIRSKGVQFLISAMPAILQQYPSAELVIAGSGRYVRALKRQVKRFGVHEFVRFVGQIDMNEQFYRELSVFVCPSADAGEGLPTVILEAMRAGCPVVATSVGGVPDLFHDRRAGLLVPPGAPEALAQAVIKVLGDAGLAHDMSIEGRRLVQHSYTVDRVAERYVRLMLRVERNDPSDSMSGHISAEVRAVHGKHLLADTSALLASKIITALVTALWTVLAARTLLPAVYGDLMVCAGLIELGAVITDAGLTAVATRELTHASRAELDKFIGTVIYLKVALGVVATSVVIGAALVLPLGGDVRKIMLVLGPSLVFVSLNSLTLVFRARLAIGYVLGASLIGAIAGVYSTTFVYWTAPSALRFAAARLAMVGAAGVVTLVMILYKYRPSVALDWVIARKFLLSSLPLGVALALNILYYRLDVPLLAVLTNTTQVAIYVSAYRILDVVTLLPAAAAAVALPLMTAAQHDGSRHLATFCRQYLELAVACGLLITVLLTVFGAPLLAVLYGGRYNASSPTLGVLAWVAAATLVTNVFMPLMVVLDRRRTVLLATALGLLVNCSLNVALIPHIGAIAAAYATLATEIVVTAPLMVVATRTIHMSLFSRPMLAAVLATGAALGANFGLHVALDVPWAAGLVALAVWGTVLFTLAPRWLMSSIEVLRSRRSPAGRPTLVAARPSTANYQEKGV